MSRNTSRSSLTAVDANAEFEAAIARLKELSGSENEQVAVKAASDLAKLLRPHVRSAESGKPLEQREAELAKAVPDLLGLIAYLVHEGKLDRDAVRRHLAPVLAALDEIEAPQVNR